MLSEHQNLDAIWEYITYIRMYILIRMDVLLRLLFSNRCKI